MKAFALSSSGNIAAIDGTSLGMAYGMIPIVIRACSSFIGAQAVDGNGAINMYLDNSANDYFWPVFD